MNQRIPPSGSGKAVSRREAVGIIAATGAAVTAGCESGAGAGARREGESASPVKQADIVKAVERLSFPWQTADPFLFCVHHDDHYPRGNEQMGPAASLAGRNIGMDFEGKDGWRMYHGDVVPGFPRHPHRGFETVTVVRRGLLDHADSMGAAARYGRGDVQWLTAGNGILHAEMFPLLEHDHDNPVELFQIWLNLPAANKRVAPHFSMLWADTIPVHRARDAEGRSTEVAIVAGRLADLGAPPPPPKSWAADPENDVAIWTLKMAPGARWTLPACRPDTNRFLYLFSGDGLSVSGGKVAPRHRVQVRGGVDVDLENGPTESELLLLQGRPIGEPVAHHGPFVMNTREELAQAYADYRRTQFGGWPWPREDPVHGREARFARHADGRIERPA
jgi:redox-sensitive bicupin YhaK (pirin superfamily)